MNFFKLAERSVLRKPVKSILLLLIVFVISTLLLSGMSCRNASVEVQDKTRQAIGAGFLLERMTNTERNALTNYQKSWERKKESWTAIIRRKLS